MEYFSLSHASKVIEDVTWAMPKTFLK